MRIWGYILIFFNIIASSVFVFFAMQVWQKRTEWQLAYLKQELAIKGLPLDPSPPIESLEPELVSFDFKAGPQHIHQIKKSILKKVIPHGNSEYGTDQIITSQTDEIKRVEKVVIDGIEAVKETSERRQRLLLLLLNLAKGDNRIGAYGLLRDLVNDSRYSTARRELAYLGRTPSQISTLSVLAAIGEVNEAITMSYAPESIRERAYKARCIVAVWLAAEIVNAAPPPYRSPLLPALPPDDPTRINPDRAIIETAIKPLIDTSDDPSDPVSPIMGLKKEAFYPKGLLYKRNPDKQQLADAIKRLKDLLGSDTGVKGETAVALIPIMAAVGENPLESAEQLAQAQKTLSELLLVRATTESEKKALDAIVALMLSTRPYPQEQEAKKLEREKNIDIAGIETLRAYFEEAEDKDSTLAALPEGISAAQSKLAALKTIRDPGLKKRLIAHVLYHLDAHLSINPELRERWFQAFFPTLLSKAVEDDSLTEEQRAAVRQKADSDLAAARTQWHQRVVAIVGLEEYIFAVQDQARELHEMGIRLKPFIEIEQTNFLKERQDLIYWTIELFSQLEDQKFQLKEHELIKQESMAQLEARVTEQKNLETELASLQNETKIALSSLEAKVSELFDVTKQLGDAQDALLGLEIQIRSSEKPFHSIRKKSDSGR